MTVMPITNGLLLKHPDIVNSSDHQAGKTNAGNTKKHHKNLDNLPAHYTQQLKSQAEKRAEIEKIKVDSRLRNLAFYYLARREYSAKELRNKLNSHNRQTYSQKQISALLKEFAEKGYQSDMRTALMLIREGIRKGRGQNRIRQEFKQKHLSLPYRIDELIELAYEDMSTDLTNPHSTGANSTSTNSTNLVHSHIHTQSAKPLANTSLTHPSNSVDWLTLAVKARVKKYGEQIPKDYQQKAKQLRFLQYRGFETDICFDALNHNMNTLVDRSD